MTDESSEELFQRSRAIALELAEAEAADDAPRVAMLTAERLRIRERALQASIDVDTAGDELLALRHQLRKLMKKKRWAWTWRALRGGSGSADRWHSDPLPEPDQRHYADERERIVGRIYELESALVAVDGMGDMPLLAPENVLRWW